MQIRIVAVVAAVLVTAHSTTAAAQTGTGCESYLGQTVKAATFDAAVAPFAKLAPKDEFETTAQYEARRTAALSGASSTLIIAKEPEDRKYIEYNADTGLLRIISYAFTNTRIDMGRAFRSANAVIKPEPGVWNLDVTISLTDKPQSTYTATNAYGAKTEVVKISRKTKAIYERPGNLLEGLFPAADKEPYVVGQIRASPEEARRLKQELKLAFVVDPKQPYLVQGRHELGHVTISNPRDVTEEFAILVADIRCGLVLDRAGKVLGAYPTR